MSKIDVSATSLSHRGDPLAVAAEQRSVLESSGRRRRFEESLDESGLLPLRATGIQTLQVNVGRVCNQSCNHCHVDAGPDRRESMDRAVAEACIRTLVEGDIPTLDITGGAPEMNPQFRYLVREAASLGRQVIDRCNLTILVAKRFEDLPEFLAGHSVRVVASLPCYLAENADSQRGDGVFDLSIQAIHRLNDVGYGQADDGLQLDLVYNPVGPSLPPSQSQLEKDYQRELEARYGVRFNRLLTITNMPIGRFLHGLVCNSQYDEYMDQLIANYNHTAAAGVMCRSTLSVSWDGRLHDCDFNQMLEVELAEGLPRTIHELDVSRLANRRIVVGQHCYGCTAGAGSGCQGAIDD